MTALAERGVRTTYESMPSNVADTVFGGHRNAMGDSEHRAARRGARGQLTRGSLGARVSVDAMQAQQRAGGGRRQSSTQLVAVLHLVDL